MVDDFPPQTKTSDDDDGFFSANSPEKEDRLGFIRKVYGILSVQLCLTTGAIASVKAIDGWNEAMQMPTMGATAMGLLFLSIVIEIAIVCCQSVARKTPTNYIMLFAFTACQAFVFAYICAFYPTDKVLSAAGTTALVTVALTFYACTTKTDITICGGLLYIMVIAMFFLIFASFFMTFVSWWHPLISSLLVVFYGIFLIYDTQLIAGGHKYELSMDDYIVGALLLYVDIMMLFLELLKLFGGRD